MRNDFPFTDYDFWAYISAGIVFLFALDHVTQSGFMGRPNWTFIEGLFTMACAYIVGHLLAGVASAVLERRLVAKWLGPPSVTLLGVKRGPTWFRRIYPSFYESLPLETQTAILEKAHDANIVTPGDALFILAFASARNNNASMDRMSKFLNLYGFCRNLSLTTFLCALLLAITAALFDRVVDYLWASASLVLSVGMFFRYLKFYRHYAVEVFTTYAYSRLSTHEP